MNGSEAARPVQSEQSGEPVAKSEKPIRRILIALDASPQSMAALQAAAELAASLEAELIGVFVEDINLVRMAGLQVAMEFGQTSGQGRVIDERRIGLELHGRAERARSAMQRAAGQQQIPWSFQVARGSIERELLARAEQVDLIILGRAGWSGRTPIGSTAEAILAGATSNTLVVDTGHRLHPTLMVIYDGSAVSRRALNTALYLARRMDRFLIVGVLASDQESARELQREVAAELKRSGMRARYRWLMGVSSRELGELTRHQEQVVLVLPGESALFTASRPQEVMQHLQCPVLVVR